MKNCSTSYIIPEVVNKKENEAKKKKNSSRFLVCSSYSTKLVQKNALSSFYVNHAQRLTKAKQGKLSVLIYTFISFVLKHQFLKCVATSQEDT
jgi:hypothetical protein